MIRHRIGQFTLLVCALSLMHGCATYKITQSLGTPLGQPASYEFGDIEDQLPSSVDPDDRPAPEDFDILYQYLEEELDKSGLFGGRISDSTAHHYIIDGAILQYKRGSGAARYFVPFGIGNAEVTLELRLHDQTTGKVLYSGNFKRTISDWTEKGQKMFQGVARDFVNRLRKEHASLLRHT